MSGERSYIAIDLKSFYASVECVERGLNPLNVNLVVADVSRTEKTICLAVSPSLKAHGIGGRARLFEVVQKLRQVNGLRQLYAPGRRFVGKSIYADELATHPELEIDYIAAPPRMGLYLNYSSRIYEIYLRYVAPEDIHVYSVDEVFMDVTSYLLTYKTTPHELASTIIRDVLSETGITATAGIGTNMYLCKVAMDIVAKHVEPDADGVRIAELDEMSYRHRLWNHRPLTDFWRVGGGIANKLARLGIYTMGQLARKSVDEEEILYKLFGVNAELLIDHAWGWEPCTMEYVKAYRPTTNSLSNGQVLTCPYTVEKARVVAQEMAEAIALSLVEKRLVADQVVLFVGYDMTSLQGVDEREMAAMELCVDHYGRVVPKHAHGTVNFPCHLSSSKKIAEAVLAIFDKVVNRSLMVRRLNVTVNHVIGETDEKVASGPVQLSLFSETDENVAEAGSEAMEKEQRIQKTLVEIKKKFGKNAILKGLNFRDGATGRDRNRQIGGHKE